MNLTRLTEEEIERVCLGKKHRTRKYRRYNWYHGLRKEEYQVARNIICNSVGKPFDEVFSKMKAMFPNMHNTLEFVTNYISPVVVTRSGPRVLESYGRIGELVTTPVSNRWIRRYMFIGKDGTVLRRPIKKEPVKRRHDSRKHYSGLTKRRRDKKERNATTEAHGKLMLSLINYPDLLKEYQSIASEVELKRKRIWSWGNSDEGRARYTKDYEKAKEHWLEVINDPDLLIDICNKKSVEKLKNDTREFERQAGYALEANKKRLEHVARMKKDFPELISAPTGKFTVVIIERKKNENT